MSEAFISDMDRTKNFGRTLLFTSSGTATYYELGCTAAKISVRGAAVYYQWGVPQNATPTIATAATQMDWIPQNGVVRVSRPQEATGIWILQDTGAAGVFVTPGRGI